VKNRVLRASRRRESQRGRLADNAMRFFDESNQSVTSGEMALTSLGIPGLNFEIGSTLVPFAQTRSADTRWIVHRYILQP